MVFILSVGHTVCHSVCFSVVAVLVSISNLSLHDETVIHMTALSEFVSWSEFFRVFVLSAGRAVCHSLCVFQVFLHLSCSILAGFLIWWKCQICVEGKWWNYDFLWCLFSLVCSLSRSFISPILSLFFPVSFCLSIHLHTSVHCVIPCLYLPRSISKTKPDIKPTGTNQAWRR